MKKNLCSADQLTFAVLGHVSGDFNSGIFCLGVWRGGIHR